MADDKEITQQEIRDTAEEQGITLSEIFSEEAIMTNIKLTKQQEKPSIER